MHDSRNTLKAGPLLRATVLFAVLGIALVFFMLAAFALPVFADSLTGGGSGVFSWIWRPSAGEFGILAMLCGSLLLALSSLLLAWPLALGLCCLTLSWKAGPAQRTVRALVSLMTAIPTVVYGFASVFLLVPLVRAAQGGGSGLCWFSAWLVLALLIFPTLVLIMEAGLRPRLEDLGLSPLALGMTRMQAIVFLVLPGARQSLITALVLGFGRAVGDTLVSLMLAGNAPQLPAGMGDSLRTLTAHMALVTANEVGGAAYNSLFAAGAIVLLLSCGVSLAVRRMGGSGALVRPPSGSGV